MAPGRFSRGLRLRRVACSPTNRPSFAVPEQGSGPWRVRRVRWRHESFPRGHACGVPMCRQRRRSLANHSEKFRHDDPLPVLPAPNRRVGVCQIASCGPGVAWKPASLRTTGAVPRASLDRPGRRVHASYHRLEEPAARSSAARHRSPKCQLSNARLPAGDVRRPLKSVNVVSQREVGAESGCVERRNGVEGLLASPDEVVFGLWHVPEAAMEDKDRRGVVWRADPRTRP